MLSRKIQEIAEIMAGAQYLSAFTGAGISVESGIPPFRGPKGIWNIYDPELFDINYFLNHPEKSWTLLRKLFFETFETAAPNSAHLVLARLEEKELLKALITQNIDNLHFLAGSRNVIEYHGNSRMLICTKCRKLYPVETSLLERLPPLCECKGVLKPDFVFFGEEIPAQASFNAMKVSEKTDVMTVIGTTGQIYPASLIPRQAKSNGARIIEVNTQPSEYTDVITDIFLQGKASEIMTEIEIEINKILKA